jgi:hypothetical protein
VLAVAAVSFVRAFPVPECAFFSVFFEQTRCRKQNGCSLGFRI